MCSQKFEGFFFFFFFGGGGGGSGALGLQMDFCKLKEKLPLYLEHNSFVLGVQMPHCTPIATLLASKAS
jgi:hypothetical protein